MKITGIQLIEQAKKHLGEPYLYGCKHEKLTLDKYNQLQKMYGKNCVWDSDKQKVGKVCCDCSGLIGISLQELGIKGYVIGSSQFKSIATTVKPISDIKNAPVGALLWLKGHIGIYIGNGEYIAEDGSAYGCRIAKLSKNKWTHYLLLENIIDYEMKHTQNDNSLDKELSNAVSKIIKSGIILDFNSWKRVDLINPRNAFALIVKLGGVYLLLYKGIISDKKLWTTDINKVTKENIASLLIKFASCL